MSSSLVKSVFQDSRGMIWISTNYGLNKYDGYDFTPIYKEDGLGNNMVNHVEEDNHGHIYVCHADGVQVITNDKLTDVTRDNAPIHCFVSHIIKRKDGTLVYSTSGIGLSIITGLYTSKSIMNKERALDFVRKIMEDNEGNLWAVTEDKGVIRIDKKGKLTKYFSDTDQCSVMTAICHDSKGNIYVGSNKGVYVMYKGTYTFKPISTTQNIPVLSLLLPTDNTLMIGSDGQGMKLLDTRTGIVSSSTFYTYKTDLNTTKVHSIFKDRSNNIWLSLFQKGLFVSKSKNIQFEYIGSKLSNQNLIGEGCVMAVYQTKDGKLWVGTDGGGLYGLDINQTEHRQIAHFNNAGKATTAPSTILCITEDENGKLWVGSFYQGCGWIDTKTGEYHRMPWSYGKATSVFELIADPKGHIWIGTLGEGLKKYDIATGKIISYRKSPTNSQASLANDYILQMRLSKDGNTLYVGISQGLSALDIKSESWTKTFGTNLIIEHRSISGIKEDRQGRLWIGTDDGLYLVEKSKRPKITAYSVKTGLPSNAISDIQEDKDGNIWISTKKGLCQLPPNTGKATNYYVNDGLQDNEFSEGVSLTLNNGKLLFGGMQGISIVCPKEAKPTETSVKIVLSALEIGNNTVKAGMKSGQYVITDTIVMASDRFDLSNQDNTITLYMSTLAYSNQDRTFYRYRINNDKWINTAEGDNNLTLARLTPGTYKIQIQACTNGIMSDIKEITIKVHNPWYFSWWVKLIYILIFALAAWWVYRTIKARQQDKLSLQKHKHAEEMNDAKLKFFINLSHEIRTPMTLITAPLGQLEYEDKDLNRKAVYAMIRRNADRILHIVDQIMDIRKIDKGQMRIQMQETDIVKMIEEIHSLFTHTAKVKGIDISFEHQDISRLNVYIDITATDKIMMNLLSNAMKYTPKGGKIVIGLSHNNKEMQLYVSNEGPTIPEEQLKKIFERFYQTQSTKSGTGVGLDLARSLTELQHGKIHAENLPEGKGCKFVVTLPLGKAHLNKEELFIPTDPALKPHGQIATETEVITEAEDSITDIGIAPPTLKKDNKTTIIIAEDDDEIRNYLQNTLSQTFNVMAYSNGNEALPAIQQHLPQLVITDVMMPGMNGHELCTKIKQNIRTNHIPVIMLTAKTMDDDVLQGLETGADEYITKPFNMDILQRTVMNLINTRRIMAKKYSGQETQSSKVENISIVSHDEKLLERIMSVINKNISNSDINVDMIAQEVGLSRVHLHRKMKELTNQTPHDFIRNLRMEQAARLLASGNYNITEVVYKCGFSNTTSFSTIFKKMYGQTPREYMKGQ